MEEILTQIIRPGTFAIAVAVFIATFFTRRVAELLYPKLKRSRDVEKDGKKVTSSTTYGNKLSLWWNEVVLYAVPVVYGALFAFSTSEFLYGQIDTLAGRMTFSAGVGWFASFLYKVFRKAIMQRVGVEIPESGS